MKRAAALAALSLLVLAGCDGKEAAPAEFSVTSPAFGEDTPIPAEYSCNGRNVPPPLHWHNMPDGTASLALVIDDPDAPNGLYVHWVVTGIPPSVDAIVDGQLPDPAVVSLNSGGKPEYLGPCPPPGTGVHHYRFQVYAQREPLMLPAATPVPESTTTIAQRSFAVARAVGIFGR